jgi:BirA family biotin operon repressor/biotin-[acetyl-CoA-carboxylase] ligase
MASSPAGPEPPTRELPGSAPADLEPPAAIVRLERFARVESTQDVVRAWLAEGQAQICLAVADEQTAGRGRFRRPWQAPPGRALLVSAGLRPVDLPLAQAWRLPAVVAMALLDAAADVLGPDAERLALKWPNDIVALIEGRPRKVGGVLAEADLDGERLRSVAVGLGVNVDWPAEAFPAELAAGMGSLSETAGRPPDREALLEAWLDRLVAHYGDLVAGRFDGRRWAKAQVTSGADVTVETVGGRRLAGRAMGVDQESGALLVRERDTGTHHRISVGEVVACRVTGSARPL